MVASSMKNIIVGPKLVRTIDTSLGDLLLESLKAHGDKILEVDAEIDEKLTASVLLKRSIALAQWFTKQGIIVGDSISVNSANRLEYSIVTVATFFVGATLSPLNPTYTPRELKHVLNLSKPKVIICSNETIGKMQKILPDHPHVRLLIQFGEDCRQDVYSYESIIANADTQAVNNEFRSTPVDPKETVATILCSSGTTGLPKGVMCTHDNITAFCDILKFVMKNYISSVDSIETGMGVVPFFHSLGFMLMFLNLISGNKLIVLSKFKPRIFLESIVKYKVTRLLVPPPVLLFLVKHPMIKDYDLSSIKEIRTGAAPMGKNIEQELMNKFVGVRQVAQNYGMTETTLGVLIVPSGKKGKLGSSGKIVNGMMAKVIDEDGNALGPYEKGEICFKGPLIMKGYVSDPESTSNTIDKDNWLHTGDVAYYDDDGYFFIVDRIKELIKYNAFQVAPAELEALLLTHPSIQDSAVIGLPDEEAGELPLAFVVNKPEKHLTERDVENFVEENASPQKKLRGGVIFIKEIPRNPTGKILRRVLREHAVKMTSKL